ncbi:hypothetical protein EV361DRAFT_872164 [Lentinula raphanica]|nr:hypothetical protein EV361DRAFT_872164 [Lentinula raphanica]
MYYLAGIHVSHTQTVEAIVAASTVLTLTRLVKKQSKWFKVAENEGGKITDRSNTFMGRLVTRVHAYAIMAAPLSYLAAVASNKLVQPEWYTQTSLNSIRWISDAVDDETRVVIRVAAAIGFIGSVWFHEVILRELGKQFHFIAVRQNASVVSTGPYAVVRHPLYTTLLGQLAIISAAYWSWIPLSPQRYPQFLGAFGYKMSLEERLMEEDPTIRDAYRDYKKKVPYKIIPYIW